MYAIGIDIGGTKIGGAVVDESGAIIAQDRVPSPAAHADQMEDAVAAMITRLSASYEVCAAGVAAAGFVNSKTGVIYYAPNIQWREEPFLDEMRGRVDLPLLVENDANAAGWGEFRFGAGRGVGDMVMLTIGTGVGGAIIGDGRLFRGGFGAGAELGHMRVVPGGLPCGCGMRGCIEQYGSGRALQRFANDLADAGGIGSVLAARRAADGGDLSGQAIADLVAKNDPGALAAVRELGGWIGQACASLDAILDPEVFILGGGVAQLGDPLLGAVRAGFLASLPARGYHPEPTFRTALLGNRAGAAGVADLARLSVQGD
ncbi:MAG TPA: ROK family protein [Microbacteriaceae bacterium]|nr:ROK family protein [Microbacteriaceae bacterium]